MRKIIRCIITVPFMPIIIIYWLLVYMIGYDMHIDFELRNGDNE